MSERGEKFEVIVVGAGPAGLSAAYVLAKAGVNVAVIERGDFPGSKNVMGGVIYTQPTAEIFPEFWKDAPLERHLIETQAWVLTEKAAFKAAHRHEAFDQEPYNAFSVFRARFDKWMAGKVRQAGALIIPETVVESAIMEDGKVVGVRTGRPDGDLYADVVIAADGVNSLLAQNVGLREEILPDQAALAVKEVVALRGIQPNDLLEHLKSHPMVAPLLEGGETREYLAHLIPEGGLRAMPKLSTHGMLVVGDAAMLINSMHREGSNLAMGSGKLAAETVLHARERNDFSAQSLSRYDRLIRDSTIYKDLYKYRNMAGFFETHPEFFGLYPDLLNEAAREMLTVDGVPKRRKQRAIFWGALKKRPLWRMAIDFFKAWRSIA